ncbi:MAG TPA: hypothetical protein VM554_04920 [Acidisarcina sp.]|nr:hypothetical protein [Acidisarcina sp.]
MLIGMKSRLLFSCLAVCVLLVATLTAFASDAVLVQSPHDLIKDVVYNELQDRQRETFWQYHVEKQVAAESFSAVQIDTKDGPISRILKRNGKPLTADEQRLEEERLTRLLKDRVERARVKQHYQEDEDRLERLMKLMPDAFLFEFDGMDGGLERLKFRPNPAFNPPTYEARIFHALGGTLWIDTQQKRLVHLKGSILDRVDFGYGLLGHVEKGGTFELKRQQVSETHWKSALIDVHVTGRVIFFKTVSKSQTEIRSDFKPIPEETDLEQARAMLDHAEAAS